MFCCSSSPAPKFESGVQVRRVGMRRVEFGNAFFRAVYDTVSRRLPKCTR